MWKGHRYRTPCAMTFSNRNFCNHRSGAGFAGGEVGPLRPLEEPNELALKFCERTVSVGHVEAASA
jgi:hypothetical protein